MIRSPVSLSLLGVVAALAGMSAVAADITIPNNQLIGMSKFGTAANHNDGAYVDGPVGIGPAGEDQEVPTGGIANQSWDYEAFTLTGNTLGIISGFDMRSVLGSGEYNAYGAVDQNGVGSRGIFAAPRGLFLTDQGDIFINIGAHVDATPSSFAFTHVIKFDSISDGAGGVSYSVYEAGAVNASPVTGDSEITGGTAHLSGFLYQVTPKDSPLGTPLYTGIADYLNDQTSAQVGGYAGTYHDVIQGIEIDFTDLGLQLGDEVYLYTTMGCGNDLLEGQFTVTHVPDGGMTLALLGVGFLAMGVLRRRMA